MIYWEIFLAFFIPGILGYGGGPASIPLVENEVVDRFGWMTTQEFSEVLALGNSLPGPIATKMAGYIGYAEGGILGAGVALFATIAPSLILMVVLLGLIMKYKDSPRVKMMSTLVRPTIAVLLGVMTWGFFADAIEATGTVQTAVLAVISFVLLERFKVHPAFVIAGALVYGAVFLG
ncbi:chromate transporter [Jeotgalibacillus salarius]|uniref:Chromate transporter n=1 Tax=Jeotgalibacillus salarius TaxID=546023 RepID=A0A4Y8LLI2_9BACL|nr:chromate transporter [Jeotgalibacillus salarius]TFE03908.1 chromate transporter [Jeotgalibacillus salarius]